MKRVGLLLCLSVLLPGCAMRKNEMNRAMELRARVLAAQEVTFRCDVVADYGDHIYTFGMDCLGNKQGDLRFEMTEPETISGICGSIAQDRGNFTFDDKIVFYELLADGQLSPVSAPWILLRTLRSGYICSVGMEGELLRITLEDTFEDAELKMDIWLTDNDSPIKGDILYDGKRILSLKIENFGIV